MACKVSNFEGTIDFHLIVVYGLHTIGDRKDLCKGLLEVLEDINNSGMIIGDINAVLHSSDRVNGNQISAAETMDFENFMNEARIMEALNAGVYYSWSNRGEQQARIASRIDKALVNSKWLDKYTDVMVHYRVSGVSDHSPLVFNMNTQSIQEGRPFKFLNILCEHENFETIVMDAWNSVNAEYKMKSIWLKLKKVKHALKQLHKPQSQAYCKIEELRKKLANVQALTDINSNSNLQQEEKDCEEKLRYWSQIEESIPRQKSRIDWLTQGDSNSKFFFAAMKARKAKNKIAQIQNDQGETLTKAEEIQGEVVGFFKGLLGKSSNEIPGIDIQLMRRGKQLSRQACDALTTRVTTEEIDAALFSIDDGKAHGIDGFNSLFFKRCWHLIKENMYLAVQEFFQRSFLHWPVNTTVVTLIPKKTNVTHAKDYRPIACCTVVYKIVSMILTQRMSKVINEVMNPTQSGFIPGRHIADNILLATELIKGYNRKHMSPRCLIKVDIKKAYDSVEWCFLEQMLYELGFPDQYIKWTMACVKSVSYSIMLNGMPAMPFQAKRGGETRGSTLSFLVCP